MTHFGATADLTPATAARKPPPGPEGAPNRRLRIAIVCDNASFRMGGEAAIPLRFFQYLRGLGHQVTLLTHERVRDELDTVLTPAERADVVMFKDSWAQQQLYRRTRHWPSALKESFVFLGIQLLTQRVQRQVLREMVRAGTVEIAFMPTPISPKVISLIDDVGVPTVFGPLNGAMNYPPAFRPRSGRLAELLIRLGRRLADAGNLIFPAKRHAAALLVSNERTCAGLPAGLQGQAILRSYDATIEADRWRAVRHDPQQLPTHFLCVGRLVDWKAFEYAIMAAHQVPGAKLIVVGDGPERPRLEALAASGQAEVQFLGHQRHEDLLAIYPRVIAQLLPSLREAGGNVCLEALAAGVPVIATAWGGATDVVADGIDGFLIEPSSEQQLVEGMAQAMRHLLANPKLARAMGQSGRNRVLEAFDWRAKARDLAGVFEACLDGLPAGMAEAHPDHVAGPNSMHSNLAWRNLPPVALAVTPKAVTPPTQPKSAPAPGQAREVRETADLP